MMPSTIAANVPDKHAQRLWKALNDKFEGGIWWTKGPDGSSSMVVDLLSDAPPRGPHSPEEIMCRTYFALGYLAACAHEDRMKKLDLDNRD